MHETHEMHETRETKLFSTPFSTFLSKSLRKAGF